MPTISSTCTPMVGLLIQGGPIDIDHVVDLLRRQVPVLVVQGSGQAADLLSFVYFEKVNQLVWKAILWCILSLNKHCGIGLCCKMFHNISFSVMEMIMSPMLRQNWSKEWWTVSPKILWMMSWRGIDAGTKSLSVSVWLIRFDIVYLKKFVIFKFQHPIYTYPCYDCDFSKEI